MIVKTLTNLVTRLVKGGELSWTEMDTNINSLKEVIIDQSERNDRVFDKGISFTNTTRLAGTENIISIDIPIIPLVLDGYNYFPYPFTIEVLIGTNGDSSHTRMDDKFYKSHLLIAEGDYPGYTQQDISPVFNPNQLKTYNFGFDAYTNIVSIDFIMWNEITSYKIVIKATDGLSSAFDFNNTTLTLSTERGAK